MQTVEKPDELPTAATRRGRLTSRLLIPLLSLSIIMMVCCHYALAADTRLLELVNGNISSSGIDTSAVIVDEDGGVVTLSGRVATDKQRKSLLDLVQRTHGVAEVIDQLESDYDS